MYLVALVNKGAPAVTFDEGDFGGSDEDHIVIAAYRQGSVCAGLGSFECLGEGQVDVDGIEGLPHEAHVASLVDAGVELVKPSHKDHLGGGIAWNIALHQVDAVPDAFEGFSRETDVHEQGIKSPFGGDVSAEEREGRENNNLDLLGELRGIEVADNLLKTLRFSNDIVDDTDHPSHLDVPPRYFDKQYYFSRWREDGKETLARDDIYGCVDALFGPWCSKAIQLRGSDVV